MMNSSFPLVAFAAALAVPAAAQTAMSSANDADRLAAEMRVIGANPTDVVALTEAGEMSTRLGDLSGAASLFARADKVDPRNGRVKAGIAAVLLQLERPGEALQLYNQAEGYGYPLARFAADRGLAYDLVAQQGRAQRDYRLALASDSTDDETVRRYALSLGISGQKEAALHLLDPLLRRNDRGGWRARSFVLAMNGESGAAQTIATTMMAPGQASGMAAFFARLPALGPADRAFAVQFGELRSTPQRLADLRLAPALPALASEIVPVARAIPPSQIAAARVDKRKRGKKGAVQLAAVALPTAPPLPVPPAYGARTLASGPALAPRTPLPGFVPGAQPGRSPIAVASLGARPLVPAYGMAAPVNRAPAIAAMPAPRVLPARSPLPPPPVLPAPVLGAQPRVAVASSGSISVTAPRQPASERGLPLGMSTPAAAVAPVALAQASPALADRYVAIERPGSLLSGYVRVPSTARSPSMTGIAPAIAPQIARVIGTLSAPAPIPISPVVPLASAKTPTNVSLAPTVPAIEAGAIAGPQRVFSATPATLDAAPFRNPSSIVITDPLPTPVTPTPRVPIPAASLATAALLSDTVPARPISAPTLGVGALAPRASLAPPAIPPSGMAMAPVAIPPISTALGTTATPAPAVSTASVPASMAGAAGGLVGPSLDTGGTVAAAITPSRPLAGGVTAIPSSSVPIAAVPTVVGLPDAVKTDEPAGIAVTRALPARDGALAEIIAALPVPASELNIAPVVVPTHTTRGASQDSAALTGGGAAPPRAVVTARGDLPDPAHASPSTRSSRRDPSATDASASGAHKRSAAAADDGASVVKSKTRRDTASTKAADPTSRKGSTARDATATGKGRHAALAKADGDDPALVHGKHGRHDSSDDDSKTPARPGKKALAVKPDAAPQKYWVQVAGGANGASLGKAWQIAQGKAPALAGRKGYTTPLHATNRVLAGPFKSDDEARAFVNTLNKQGVHAFQFTNDKGQKVNKLGDE